jgi:hypothetical protein
VIDDEGLENFVLLLLLSVVEFILPDRGFLIDIDVEAAKIVLLAFECSKPLL